MPMPILRRLARPVLFSLFAIILSPLPTLAASPLVIGEVNWAGSSLSTADEWIELWNLGTDPIQLNGYKLVGAGGENGINFGTKDLIASNGTFIIANYRADEPKSALTVTPQVVTTTVSLPNDKLRLQLFDANGTVVDSVGDEKMPSAGASLPVKTSMIRTDPAMDGATKDAWKDAGEAMNLKSGITDLGTPGFMDFIAMTPTPSPPAPDPEETPPTIEEPTATEPVIEQATSTNEFAEATTTTEEIIESTSTEEIVASSSTDPLPEIEIATSTQTTSSGSITTESTTTAIETTPTVPPSPIVTTTYAPSSTSPPKPKAATAKKAAAAKPKAAAAKPKTIVPAVLHSTSSAAIKISATKTTTTKKQAVAPHAAPSRATSVKKTAAKSIMPTVYTSLLMTSIIDSGIHISVTGTVATIAKLLASHQFVIQNPDGRGLLVQGNDKQPTPPLGSQIRISGTLIQNDAGITLKMSAKDRWAERAKEQTVQTRTVDLFAPDQEDAWSLIDVTGTVMSVKKTLVDLDLGDSQIQLMVRPVIKYRTTQLKIGDVIHVRGVIDTRGETIKLYPRAEAEIVLVEHAKPAVAAAPAQNGLPPWTPFGAAGLTVVAAQGYRRVQKHREKKRLENLLTHATQQLTHSSL